MMSLLKVPLHLRFARQLSSIFLVIMAQVSVAAAHEVVPTIGDLTIDGDRVSLELRLNVETFVSQIDQDVLEDTDLAENAALYDVLRGFTANELDEEFRRFWPKMSKAIQINAREPVSLYLSDVSIPPIGDVDLPRPSMVKIVAAIPADQPITVTWPAEYGTLILRQQGVDDPYTGTLTKGETSAEIGAAGGNSQSAFATLLEYIPIGVDHIVPKGLDHILFVLGLFFLAAGLRPLIWQISAFTVAHTITLGMATLGIVSVPASFVEPLIAASIVYVAVENIFSKGGLSPWRPVFIFALGLLHGLGFASVLGDFGLPEGHVIPALIGFNIGVELGQLLVIFAAFLLVGLWFRNKPWYRERIAIPASIAIAIVGAYWVVERVFL